MDVPWNQVRHGLEMPMRGGGHMVLLWGWVKGAFLDVSWNVLLFLCNNDGRRYTLSCSSAA